MSSDSLSVPVSESVPLELVTTVASMVGLATCSINSRMLGVSSMSSGRDATTAERDSIPRFEGTKSVSSDCLSPAGFSGAHATLFCTRLLEAPSWSSLEGADSGASSGWGMGNGSPGCKVCGTESVGSDICGIVSIDGEDSRTGCVGGEDSRTGSVDGELVSFICEV